MTQRRLKQGQEHNRAEFSFGVKNETGAKPAQHGQKNGVVVVGRNRIGDIACRDNDGYDRRDGSMRGPEKPQQPQVEQQAKEQSLNGSEGARDDGSIPKDCQDDCRFEGIQRRVAAK